MDIQQGRRVSEEKTFLSRRSERLKGVSKQYFFSYVISNFKMKKECGMSSQLKTMRISKWQRGKSN